MKKIAFVLVLVLFFSVQVVSTVNAENKWLSFNELGKKDQAQVKLINPQNSGVEVEFDIPGMEMVEIFEQGKTYHKVKVINGGYRVDIGQPEVPIVSQLIEIPQDVEYVLDVKTSKPKIVTGYDLYPVQAPAPDVAEFNDRVVFTVDQATYSTDAFYPDRVAIVDEEMIIRGRRLIRVVVHPVQYNPVTSELKIYSNVKVKVNYDKPKKVKVDKRLKSKTFDTMLEPLVINYDQKPELIEYPSLQSTTGADYLVITHDDYVSYANSLVAWKGQKGLATKVTKLSDIGTNPSADDITNYIKNAYNNWNPAPSYVLLIGDADKLPVHYKTNHPYHSGNTGTDLYYAAVDGTDYYPDIYVGRLPGGSTSEVDAMVDKILDYEKRVTKNTYWYDDVLFAAYYQDSDLNNYADRWFLQTSEEVNTFMDSQEYNTTTSYVKTAGSSATYYRDGTQVPSTITFLSDSTATQRIIDTINNGAVIVNHRDHGASRNYGNSYDGWGDPHFTTSNISSLNNTSIWPVVFTINCMTGWFDSETDAYTSRNYESLAEAFIRKSNSGAVAVIGATRISFSGYNDDLCKGFYDSMFPSFKTYSNSRNLHLGAILNYGKLYMKNNYSGSDTYYKIEFEEFVLLGDPETTIRIFEDIDPSDSKNVNYPVGVPKYYELKINTAGTYTLETHLYSSSCDTVMYLYDYDWNQVGYNDDGGAGLYSKITSTLNPGTYYIKVIEYGENGVLKFNLTVN